MSNNWTDQDDTPSVLMEEPFRHPPFVPSDREARITKHIARLQAAEEMYAEDQISKPELENIRTRMLQVIEVPGA